MTEPSILDEIKATQDANFEQKMREVTFVGNLTGWRKLKDNKVRSKILAGYAKMMHILNK